MTHLKTSEQYAQNHVSISDIGNMTNHRIQAMQVIDSYEYLRLLYEPKTKYYFVFNKYTHASHYSKHSSKANAFFDQCIGHLS